MTDAVILLCAHPSPRSLKTTSRNNSNNQQQTWCEKARRSDGVDQTKQNHSFDKEVLALELILETAYCRIRSQHRQQQQQQQQQKNK